MNIAVAVDGSEHSIRAVEHAIEFARNLKEVKIFILHVDEIQDIKNAYLLAGGENSIAIKQAELLNPIRQKLDSEGISWQTVLLKGEPSEEIITYVNKNIQHLFIGSRGLNRFQKLVLGSVSHRVMKYALCPVTIIK